jgi:hypothetical protein
MELLKSYKVVITVVLIVVVLVLIRATGLNHFKNNARKWAEPSLTHSNIITPEQVASFKGNTLTINLDNKIFLLSQFSIRILLNRSSNITVLC